MEIPDDIIADLLPAIRAQLVSPDTPFVKETLARLCSEGHEEATALELMAQILAVVGNDMLTSGKPFDLKTYEQLLTALPKLPDESGQTN